MISRRARWAFCAFAAASVAVSSAVFAEAPRGLSRAIVNGDASPGDDAVVALLTSDRRLGCTGTLIRPHVVLTGAHCIDTSRGEPSTIFVDADLSMQGNAFPIVQRLIHPEFVPEALSADIALVAFEGELDVEPLAIERDAQVVGPTELEVRVVGYGCTDLSDTTQGVGLRRARRDAIIEVTRDQKLRHGDSTCRGDSGGPVLQTSRGEERVLGVTSSGGSKDGVSFSLATSVPAFGAWVDAKADEMEEQFASAPRRDSANGCATGGSRRPDTSWLLCAALLILCRARYASLCRVR